MFEYNLNNEKVENDSKNSISKLDSNMFIFLFESFQHLNAFCSERITAL